MDFYSVHFHEASAVSDDSFVRIFYVIAPHKLRPNDKRKEVE